LKTLLPTLIACLALSACVETSGEPATSNPPEVEPKKEPWIETHDHSDSAWLFDVCDNFPNLYGMSTTIGGTPVCNGGAKPTSRIVGYGIK
jgi:hypothetical protein